MANVLGQLLVELGVNTAAFKDGLDKATYQAKQVAKEIKDAFSGVGDSLRDLGGEFGAIGSQIANLGAGIADALGPLLEMEAPAAVVGGLVAAFAAAGVGAIGVAVHFSETAAHLHDLSEATGIAVEQLSVLGGVAATKGVDIDTMAKSLEKMDKAALAAAQSGPKSSNAFKDLGVAVKDADGSMRSAQAIFDDVSAKFATMPDGPLKTAEAIKIFGRGGAALIPVLNEGGAKIAEMEGHLKSLNAVIDGETAEASEKLKENISLMGDAFVGIENDLTKALLPALTVVTKEFVSFFEENQTGIVSMAAGIANIAKVFINVFQVIGDLLADFFNAFLDVVQGMQTSFAALGTATYDAAHGNFKQAWEDIKTGAKDVKDGVVANFSQMVQDIKAQGKSIGDVWTASMAPAKKPGAGNGGDPTKNADTGFIDKAVAALERQANKEAELAKAIGLVSVATIDANATAEANLAIQKLIDEATDKGIEKTAGFQSALAKAIPRIQEATKWQAAFKAEIEAQKEFDNFDKKIQQQVKSLQDAADAGTVVERQYAKNNATLLPLQNTIAALSAEYSKLAANPATDPAKLKEFTDKLEALNGEYKTEVENVNKLNEAFSKAQAQAEAKKLNEEIIKLKGNLDSIKNGDAFLNMGQQMAYLKDIVGLTDKQITDLLPKLQQIRKLQIESAVNAKEKSLGFDPEALKTISAEITQLKSDWEAGNIGAQEYNQTLILLNKEQADLQAKTGGFTAGIKAGFADLAANVQTNGQLMQSLTNTALKGIGDNFSEMVTTGKAKWGDLVSSMEQMLIKSAINSILSGLFNKIAGALGGGSGGGFFSGLGSMFGGGHAMGGNVTPGMSYLVGEKGPELFTPSDAGTITPNGQAGPGGNQTINQNFNIQTPDADSFRKSQSQIMATAFAAQATANRHNG